MTDNPKELTRKDSADDVEVLPPETQLDLRDLSSEQMFQLWNFTSPFPPPQVLREYKDIDPGLVDLIKEQTAKEGNHRREMESVQITRGESRADKGQIFGFILIILIVGTGIYLIYRGEAAGYVVFFTGIITLVTSYITGINKHQSQLRDEIADKPDLPDKPESRRK